MGEWLILEGCGRPRTSESMSPLERDLISRPQKPIVCLRLFSSPGQAALFSALLFGALPVNGCHPFNEPQRPAIVFTRVPPIGGGAEFLDRIGGRVVNGRAGTQVVLYAHSGGAWWVQPFRSHPLTDIANDGSWANATHLGAEYAALLVSSGYQPESKLSALPSTNANVLAVATTNGSSERPADPKVIHFSGYDWKVTSSPNDHGGEICDYEPSNAWVDDRGYLHLLMGQDGGHWNCAGVALTRSLGYGTYRFVIGDSAHLPPSAVVAMLTRDEDRPGFGIELSRWGKEHNRNTDYVVQPYYIPENTVYFDIPPGPVTHLLRWEPGSVAFRSFIGVSRASRASVMDHVFTSGVPVPASEMLHLDLYDFHHSHSGLQHPVEIVVHKFEYLP